MSVPPSTNPRLFSFVGSHHGPWRVLQATVLCGDPLPAASHLSIEPGPASAPSSGGWVLHGATSNDRYVVREEKSQLARVQEGLGRPASLLAALIPIRKTAAWWALTQDERREVFESQSRHIGIGMRYLPAIARRLHHCRDLETAAPFDFLTWFEYASADVSAFEELLHALRTSPEWHYVDREVDLRLERV